MHISDPPLFSPLFFQGLMLTSAHREPHMSWKTVLNVSSIQMIYLITIMDHACYLEGVIMESEGEKGSGSLW